MNAIQKQIKEMFKERRKKINILKKVIFEKPINEYDYKDWEISEKSFDSQQGLHFPKIK